MSDNVVRLFKQPDTDTAPAVDKPIPAPDQPQLTRRWVRSGRAIKSAATHERTKTVARAVIRHGMYVLGGTRIVVRRTWEGRTAARYERMLRAAEGRGAVR